MKKQITLPTAKLPTLCQTAITLPTRVHIVVFPVVMYGCERWIIKKGECQRIDAFELWCWRSLLWVLWTAKRSKQSILKENSVFPECSLKRLMLKLQYLGLLMKSQLIWKDSHFGKDRRQKEKGAAEDEMVGWHHQLNWHELEKRVGHNLMTEKGFPDSSVGKESACNAGDPGSSPELGRSSGEVIGYPLQHSWTSLMAQLVKNLPAMQKTWVQSLG